MAYSDQLDYDNPESRRINDYLMDLEAQRQYDGTSNIQEPDLFEDDLVGGARKGTRRRRVPRKPAGGAVRRMPMAHYLDAGRTNYSRVFNPLPQEAYAHRMPVARGGRHSASYNFFNGVKHGLSDVGRELAPVAKKAAIDLGKKAIQQGISNLPSLLEAAGRRRHTRKPRARGGAISGGNRGAIVSAVMRKHGLALGAASRFVKEQGLY